MKLFFVLHCVILLNVKGGIDMALTKEDYTKRLVDDEISELLKSK